MFNLFKKQSKTRTMLDDVQEVSSRLIVKGYRRIAAQHGCAPTEKTTDVKIMEIYTLVTTTFHQAAKQRGEQISALYDNHIVLKFLQLYEMTPGHLEQHLQYEIKKYLVEGLRPEHKQELQLFNPNDLNDPDVKRLRELHKLTREKLEKEFPSNGNKSPVLEKRSSTAGGQIPNHRNLSVSQYEKMRDSLVAQGKSMEEAEKEAANWWWKRNPEVKTGPSQKKAAIAYLKQRQEETEPCGKPRLNEKQYVRKEFVDDDYKPNPRMNYVATIKAKTIGALIFFIGCWFCLWCTLGLFLAWFGRGNHPDTDLATIAKIITFISVIVTLFRIPKIKS
jgi:hypothetical protein